MKSSHFVTSNRIFQGFASAVQFKGTFSCKSFQSPGFETFSTDKESEAKMEELVSILRSCLLTSKTGRNLVQLTNDYREMEGTFIPYRAQGFNSLEALLRSRPDAFRLGMMMNGQINVVGIPTEETAHIQDLVAKQRWARKKGKSLGYHYNTQQRRPNAQSAVMNRYPPYSRNTPSFQPPSARPVPYTTRPAPFTTRPAPSIARPPPTIARPPPTIARPAPPAVQRTPVPPARVEPPAPQPVRKPVSPPPPPQPVRKPVSPPPPRVQPPVLKPNPVPEQPRPAALVSPPPPVRPAAPAPVAQATKSRPLSDRLMIKPVNVTPHQPVVTKPPENPAATSQRILPVPTVVTSRDDDPRTRLREMAKRLSISSPQYTFKTMQFHGKDKVFCWVSMESDNPRTSGINSYPNEAETKEDAEKLAATVALEVLHEVYDRPVPKTVTADKNVIKQRLLAIVDEHGGVFELKVPEYYMDKYNEALPDHWATFVNYFPRDLIFETNLIDHRILYRYDEHIAKANSSTEEKLSNPVPSEFIFPSGQFVPVYISHVSSTTGIWANIIDVDYSDKLVAMSQKMSTMYRRGMNSVKQPNAGEYYVAYDDDDWERVRVDSIDRAKKTAQVFLIDRGYHESINWDLLYPFDKELCHVPPQAVQLAMAGLECLHGCKTATNVVREQLLGKRRYICLTSGDTYLPSVVFYDTSTEQDILVNDEVQKKIIENFQSEKFKTRTNVKVFEVTISHVDTSGKIYLRINNDGFEIVSCVIDQFLKINDISTTASVQYIDRNDIYLVRCEDGKWLRGKLIAHVDNDRKVEMHLIDDGKNVIVDYTKILHVKPHKEFPLLSAMLAEFPAQAFLVTLHNIPDSTFDKLTVDQLMRLAPSNLIIVCKVISDFPKPPAVELFKRSESDNALISINNTVALLPELDRSNGDGNNNVKPTKNRLEGVNSPQRYLPKPSMAAYKALDEVRVTDLVVSPSHFIVNPRKQLGEFKQLMSEMQKHCKSYTGIKFTVDMVNKGTLCAAKYSDVWYRAYVQSVKDDGIDVYLCDYGRPIPSLSIDNLLPLPTAYCTLPQQAIKAQLHGIKPKNGDWSPTMCMKFRDLVAGKDFFTQVYDVKEDVNEDEYLPTKYIVNLELIDTSPTADIRIRQRLLEDRVATLISEMKI